MDEKFFPREGCRFLRVGRKVLDYPLAIRPQAFAEQSDYLRIGGTRRADVMALRVPHLELVADHLTIMVELPTGGGGITER